MNAATIKGKLKILVAAVSMAVLAGMSIPAYAGVVDGAVGAVGGVVGGVGKAVDGALGGLGNGGSSASNTSGGGLINNNNGKGIGVNAGVAKVGIDLNKKKILKAKLKLQALGKNGVNAKLGASLLDGDSLLNAKGKVSVFGKNGVNAKLGARALSKDGEVLNAKAHVNALGPNGVNAKVGLSLGGRTPSGPDGPGGPGNPVGLGKEIAGLSSYERTQLKKKCGAVLASPASYNRDAVQVCRVLAQLAAL